MEYKKLANEFESLAARSDAVFKKFDDVDSANRSEAKPSTVYKINKSSDIAYFKQEMAALNIICNNVRLLMYDKDNNLVANIPGSAVADDDLSDVTNTVKAMIVTYGAPICVDVWPGDCSKAKSAPQNTKVEVPDNSHLFSEAINQLVASNIAQKNQAVVLKDPKGKITGIQTGIDPKKAKNVSEALAKIPGAKVSTVQNIKDKSVTVQVEGVKSPENTGTFDYGKTPREIISKRVPAKTSVRFGNSDAEMLNCHGRKIESNEELFLSKSELISLLTDLVKISFDPETSNKDADRARLLRLNILMAVGITEQ